jgi:hypothetical protein
LRVGAVRANKTHQPHHRGGRHHADGLTTQLRPDNVPGNGEAEGFGKVPPRSQHQPPGTGQLKVLSAHPYPLGDHEGHSLNVTSENPEDRGFIDESLAGVTLPAIAASQK